MLSKFLELVKNNPALPVVPMVEGRILFKSYDDVFDVLEHCLTDDEFEALPESETECRPYYDALPWVKAIVVYITTP